MKKKVLGTNVLLALLVFIYGCDKIALSPIEVVQWVENPVNGLKVEQRKENFRFQVQYKPLDYIVAMEERKHSLLKATVEARKQELGDHLDYFSFKISPATQGKDVWAYVQQAENPQVKSDLTYYLSYEMKKDFYLLDGKDTLGCSLYQFVNTSGISPDLDFVMAFEKRPEKDRLLVYDDKVFGLGPVQLKVKKESINHIPTLKTQ